MPVFTSAGPLIAALEATVVPAVDYMAESILNEVKTSVDEYYGEWTPARYIRTGTLGEAPTNSGASGGGGSASAEVYMDTSLAYHTGTWNMTNVIDSTEHGLHGGFFPFSTAVWSEPMGRAHAEEHELWIEAFAAAGLSIS